MKPLFNYAYTIMTHYDRNFPYKPPYDIFTQLYYHKYLPLLTKSKSSSSGIGKGTVVGKYVKEREFIFAKV